MSTWSELIKYCNDHVGTSIYRKDLNTYIDGNIDVYRRTLTLCGYLDCVGSGTYFVKHTIPISLTTEKAKRKAYPKQERIGTPEIII